MTSLARLNDLLPYLAQPLVPTLFALSRYVGTCYLVLRPRVLRCMRKRACRKLVERILLQELLIVLIFAVLGLVEAVWRAEISAQNHCPNQPWSRTSDHHELPTCEAQHSEPRKSASLTG